MFMRFRLGGRPPAVKHVCRECESRRALFRYRGIVKWDRYHTLCFQCYRRHLDRQRAVMLAAGNPAAEPAPAPNRAAVA
jgi:hypothetical protein